jgi:flagellar hook-associated protein 2
MALSTQLVSGLSSGLDWRSMIDQLMALEHRSVDLVEKRKSEYEAKVSAWQSFNTNLLSLKTAAQGLKDPDEFRVYTASMTSNSSTVDGEDLLSVNTGTTAATGTYTIKVTDLATAHKLSSNPFASQTEALGSAYAGDILVNGKVVTVSSTDALTDVAYNINALNSGGDPRGVTATVISYGSNDHRLILTSNATGKEGLSLLNGSSANLVQKFGWKDNLTLQVKNSITNGAQSDLFSAHNVTLKSLLGLSAGEASTGTLTVGGSAVTINVSTMSLTDIKTAINNAAIPGVEASVVSETVEGETFYRLQIEGTETFVDEKNILQTLGIMDHTSTSVTGKVSGNPMTSDGAFITSDTLLANIDGYISYTAGDQIQMTGTNSGGGLVSHTFSISSSTTVADLLSAIETQYAASAGDVVAYVASDGKIRVDDVAGSGTLSVTLADHLSSGQLEFVTGDLAFGNGAARQREIVAAGDARLEVDGVAVSSSSNTVENVLGGVTLNLLKEDEATTITLKIEHDLDSIKSSIQDFVDKYNGVMSYINSQLSYDKDAEKTGGVLFGDGTISSVKSDLATLLSQNIWGVNSEFSILGLVGITLDNDLILSVDDNKLTGYLKTNFSDVMDLFAGNGTTSTSSLNYIAHSRESEAGDYTVHIDRAATQATETGNVDLSGGGAADTLTITQGNSIASVAITGDMTLFDIIHQVNSELDSEYAETLVGDAALLGGGNAITAQTKWLDIDGASLQNGDMISFTGTNRSGNSVSGTYTLDNIATDTVQGLLSAIEQAYSSNVSATIDTSGRMVLTDKYTGSSQLALSISEPVGRGLDLGTIDVTPGVDDGSQEGRYALSVTASDDGSGHLVLKSDHYGSSDFTISHDSSDNNSHHIIYSTTTHTTAATNGAVHISGSTTWADVYGANVTSGDTITVAGKARDGATDISATYTIADESTDTIAGLLTEISNAYSAQGTTVNAFIRDGKICVEDTTQGASSVSLTLTCNNQGGGSLNFGTVDQTTKRDLDLGLIDGTVTGQDVAGTIHGEVATGAGRVLTGCSGNANTAGLSVAYTGSSNNVDAGTIRLTLGVAALFDRSLYSIADPSDGYATFRQNSLQDSIEHFDTQIEEMEARLEIKMQTMINRFVAMEVALGKIQNQSNWLAGQINSL